MVLASCKKNGVKQFSCKDYVFVFEPQPPGSGDDFKEIKRPYNNPHDMDL